MNTISFNGSLVERHKEIKPPNKYPAVKERQINGRYKDIDVFLIKVSKTRADKKSIKALQKLWNYECNFVGTILADRDYYSKEDKSIYVLSEQKDNFRKIDPKKILCIAELTKNKNNFEIDYIQARPDCIKGKKKRPYKRIGDVMMERLIDLTEEFKIYLKSLPDIVEYYKRFGYKVLQENVSTTLMLLVK